MRKDQDNSGILIKRHTIRETVDGLTKPNTCHGCWMQEECEPGLVSVVIPTYNRSSLIAETLDSVWSQTYRPIELIVVDDGSTDNTTQVIEDWRIKHSGDERFSLRYTVQEHSGAPAARNLGLIESRGEYIQFLDSDDLLHPQKLGIQVGRLLEDPSLEYVYSGTGKFGEKIDWDSTPYVGYPVPGNQMLASFLRGGMWNTLSGIYRRRACVAIGPWDESVPIYQDWEYNIRFLFGDPHVCYVDGMLSLARFNNGGRITEKSMSEECLRGIYRLNKEWERLFRNAGRLEKDVEWALAARHFKIVASALRQGFTDLARDAADSVSALEAEPGQAHKFAIWRFLAFLPGWAGCNLARVLMSLLSIKNRIKRWVISDSVPTEFLHYVVVGGIAFVVDFGALIFLAEAFGLHYLLSAAIAFCCGLATNYVLCVRWVFKTRSFANRQAEFVVFSIIGVIGLAINEFLMYLGTDVLGLDYRFSKLIAVTVVLIWNFGVRKVLLFGGLDK